MSFFKKGLASIFGIGGTKVDTVLNSRNVYVGEKITGNINIFGGEVEQFIDKVVVSVNTTYEVEHGDNKYNDTKTIQEFKVEIDKIVYPNEDISIPFSFELSENCPISKGNSRTVISTRLDIENAVDNHDGDSINVLPNRYMQNVLDAIGSLGFRTKEIETIKGHNGRYGFVQEFEFVPYSGSFRGKLDELELIFLNDENGSKLYLQVDRKVRGLGSFLAETFELDESYVSIYFSKYEMNDSEFVEDKLYNLIARHC